MGRLIILSGPSCVGKSSLHKALLRLYPEFAARLQKLVLYASRPPRPGEREGIDYHFRSRDAIERLRDKPGFTVIDVRGDLQAVSQDDLQHALSCGEAFVEGNPFIGLVLLHQLRSPETQAVSAFMAPLSKDEIRFLQSVQPAISLSNFVADVMRRKLLRRAQRQKGVLAEVDLAEVERRAMSAYAEMKLACQFDYVLPNHDGEDSDNWDAFYFPVGDARRALLAFRALVEGTEPRDAERWEPDLLA